MRKETVYFLSLAEIAFIEKWRSYCVNELDCKICLNRAECEKTFGYFQEIKKELGG